jgi:DNA-binding winged helix-turn-helix (wHTH) protein
MTTKTRAERAPYPDKSPLHSASRAAAEAALEFGRFQVLLRQRQLLTDGVPIQLGTRAFDILLTLLEADGSLVSKDELISRAWPRVVVTEENLKVQICALHRALGEDRNFIRTEFGRGYRITAAVRSTVAWGACQRPMHGRHRSTQILFPQWISRRPSSGWSAQAGGGRCFHPAHGESVVSGGD